MSYPTKKGITIIYRMLKVNRPAEEWELQCKEPLPCRLIINEKLCVELVDIPLTTRPITGFKFTGSPRHQGMFDKYKGVKT